MYVKNIVEITRNILTLRVIYVIICLLNDINNRKAVDYIMAETTNLNIRIDKELKEQAEVFFNELGLNMSSAFNIFVRQSLRQGKIPFELSVVADPFYSSSNMAVLRKSVKEADEGKFVTKTIDELRAMEE